MSPSAQWGYARQALSYTLTLKNMNSAVCPSASFAVAASLPEGWAQSPAALSETLASGASVTRSLLVTSAATAVPGFFTITETSANDADASLQGSSTASYNVLEPDLLPPLVEITSPADGQNLSGRTVTISVSATDAGGIAKVEISIDGVLRSTDTSAPYEYNWNIRKLSSGPHVIRAVAWDAAGNSAVDENVASKSLIAHR